MEKYGNCISASIALGLEELLNDQSIALAGKKLAQKYLKESILLKKLESILKFES